MANLPQQTNDTKNINELVADRIERLQDEGLQLPANYSPQNALKAATLRLQSVKDKQGQPALKVCTNTSIVSALLDMTIQGLSPAKNQCYFIIYGSELRMQRSYFGTVAALKRLASVDDIDAQVVHQGDEFEIGADEIGHIIVTKFNPSFTNLDKPIKGAFAFIKLANGRTNYTVMTKSQIDTSWSQSQNRQNKVQDKFSDEMAKRTVLNRAAKMFINTSDDSDLLTGSINAATETEYEEPKDVTNTAKEEVTSNKLLAGFKKAQAAEKEPKKEKKDVPQAPEKSVEENKVEDEEVIELDIKNDPGKDLEGKTRRNETELPDGQTSIYDFIEGGEENA